MKRHDTIFPFLEEDCRQIFGREEGYAVFQQTEEIYQELLRNADYRNSEAIRRHLQDSLLPAMAYYKALLAGGITQENALEYVRLETRKPAENKKDGMRSLAKLPLAYWIFRTSAKKHMRKNFPDEGWQTEWVRSSSREIHFNLRRCIYWDLTNTYGCPELCRVYCENDEITFSGLLPKIRFERTGTLGRGAACCDFHFFNNKRPE